MFNRLIFKLLFVCVLLDIAFPGLESFSPISLPVLRSMQAALAFLALASLTVRGADGAKTDMPLILSAWFATLAIAAGVTTGLLSSWLLLTGTCAASIRARREFTPSGERFYQLCASSVVALSLFSGVVLGWESSLDPATRWWWSFRLRGLTNHPNSLGFLAALVLAWTWSSLMTLSARKRFLLRGALLATVALSGSQSAMISAIVVVVISVRSKNQLNLLRRYTFGVSICAVTLASALSFGLLEKLPGGSEVAASLAGRRAPIEYAMSSFTANPLLGAGHALFSPDEFIFSGKTVDGVASNIVRQAHNQIAQVLGAGGVIGMTIMALLFRRLWRLSGTSSTGLLLFSVVVSRFPFEALLAPAETNRLGALVIMLLMMRSTQTSSPPMLANQHLLDLRA